MQDKPIPQAVIDAGKKWHDTKFKYIQTKDGYEVYSPIHDYGYPTGLPSVYIYKDGVAECIYGTASFVWKH